MDANFDLNSNALVPLNEKDDDDSLEGTFLRMYKSKINTDVKIVLKNEKRHVIGCLEAHKIVLATKSPIFADMFWNIHNSSPRIVLVQGVTMRGLDLLLWFIYSDNLKANTVDELIEVAKAARHFQVAGLVRLCKRQLSKIPVELDNVFYILEASHYFKMEGKREICLSYIRNLPKELIFKAHGFLKVSEETIRYILKKRDISSKDEIYYLEGVIHWLVHHNPRERKLLSEIYILSITHEKFLDIIEKFPSFFSHRETASILSNLLRPGSMDLPSWCKSNDSFPLEAKSYDIITLSATKVETDSNIHFRKSFLLGGDSFDESVTFEIKLSTGSITQLTMFELAFGSGFVPAKYLQLNLFRNENGPIQEKVMVPFTLHDTSNHYYVILQNGLGVSRHYPLVLHLELRVNGLRKWGDDGPVSNGQYRIVLAPGDIFYNMKLDTVKGGIMWCLTLLSDWLVFLNPISGEKRFAISAFYFDL